MAALRSRRRECREAGLPFLYDLSQQVARLTGEELAEGLAGASILIVNDYEFGILAQKTDLAREEMERRVGALIITIVSFVLSRVLTKTLYKQGTTS